ncbi:hypothetical protein SAMN02745181_0608 [Rubritalea squalenifaciens DSM 18772]|uniref:DUF3105 domain-containing protein n=1 Tax=Rubritalea squalenifaciens DSM 18772 TaxID=1123071 RepID=A0A1M6CZH7_9BACT|nr:hypothetical protein [Rubritalea squalenifaciens]SHI66406.1 hypothetical protein SAMN02745181_0608 [Rubritalea squalenifaciens DSM 18772]
MTEENAKKGFGWPLVAGLAAVVILAIVLSGVALSYFGLLRSDDEIRDTAMGDYAPFLRQADKLELYSLVPSPHRDPDGNRIDPDPQKTFHGYYIYGKIEITDPNRMDQVRTAVHQSVATERNPPMMHCFNPRHGVRAYWNGEVRDYLICFQCASMEMFPAAAAEKSERVYFGAQNFAKVLNDMLDANGIKRSLPQ